MKKLFLLISISILSLSITYAQKIDTLSINLENVKYPYALKYLPLSIDGQDVKMAYMDVAPTITPNGRTIMLFHGKNFGGYYWGNVIRALTGVGFRVIAPDQIGFGRSSKPIINYTFEQLVNWNKKLLDTLSIQKTSILGHSMGGMLATRFALMYPDRMDKLLLENPIGLEDYKTFVPASTVEEQYQRELKNTAESIRQYYRSSYFTVWKPDYEYLVNIGAGVTFSADFPKYAKVAALTYNMIYNQPVADEFRNLKVPTILFIGKDDKTIVGKGLLSADQQAIHGLYRFLGKNTALKIPGSKIVEFDACGHIPHIEITTEFLIALTGSL
ncbi:alpha/beta hydrolase [Pedobacter aquatilis]|uniref:alpha/beta fold hydrolase n=1 Tax=Pedobacter aquatilis TaxID=351343 RepID=UPI0025B60D92|nr:alpha/beta hydrolase [Pedobacter aquatilis]MDN3587681.1 alpha/beta hydrolase [Pedobacter aquatilis]